MKFRFSIVLLIVLAVLFTACGSNQVTSVPATNTPRPIVQVATS